MEKGEADPKRSESDLPCKLIALKVDLPPRRPRSLRTAADPLPPSALRSADPDFNLSADPFLSALIPQSVSQSERDGGGYNGYHANPPPVPAADAIAICPANSKFPRRFLKDGGGGGGECCDNNNSVLLLSPLRLAPCVTANTTCTTSHGVA